MTVNTESKTHERQRDYEERRRIHLDREIGELLVNDVCRAEWQKRKTKKKAEVRALHHMFGRFNTLYELLMVQPVDASERKREQ
jgi:hypothetical protein